MMFLTTTLYGCYLILYLRLTLTGDWVNFKSRIHFYLRILRC